MYIRDLTASDYSSCQLSASTNLLVGEREGNGMNVVLGILCLLGKRHALGPVVDP